MVINRFDNPPNEVLNLFCSEFYDQLSHIYRHRFQKRVEQKRILEMEEIMNIIEELVDYSRLCWDRGLTESTGGNMSVRANDNTIYITPTFTVKHFLKPKDIVRISLDDEKLGGEKEPSSERKMHLLIYKERPDVNAIFHAHPPYATAFAVSGEKIPINVLPEAVLLLRNIAYLPYKMPGTQEFADAFNLELKKGKDVFILQNHGVTVVGKSIKEAYARLETLEFLARIVMITKDFGGIHEIPQKEIREYIERIENDKT